MEQTLTWNNGNDALYTTNNMPPAVIPGSSEYEMIAPPPMAKACSNGKQSVIYVPQVRSMRDYLIAHCHDEIIDMLNKLAAGDYTGIYVGQRPVLRFYTDTLQYDYIGFWRTGITCLTAVVRISILGSTESSADESSAITLHLASEIYIDLEDEQPSFDIMSFTAGYIEPPSDTKLDNYLIPVMSKEDILAFAEKIMREKVPSAFNEDGKFINGPDLAADKEKKDAVCLKLAAALGLKVEFLKLYKKPGVRSMMFFTKRTISVQDKENEKKYVRKLIEADTIVVNSDSEKCASRDLDVFHECMHYLLHYMFFRLQALHNSDVSRLRMEKKVITEKQRFGDNPVAVMEWQARIGSLAAIIPQSFIRSEITKIHAEASQSGTIISEVVQNQAKAVCKKMNIPKYCYRARLIQSSLIYAKGALNFVDDRYVAPFTFSEESFSKDTTFVIDRDTAFAEYNRNKKFRDVLRTGKYVYVDGHFCINDPDYVTQDYDGNLQLTMWARRHIDQCCLRFREVYRQKSTGKYEFGSLHCDESYNEKYFSLTNAGGNAPFDLRASLEAYAAMTGSLPSGFGSTLTAHMEMRSMSVEALAEAAALSPRTITRLRNDQFDEISSDHVMGVCIGLGLPPLSARDLFDKAGVKLKGKRRMMFSFILDTGCAHSIEEVNKLLVSVGQKKLYV